MCQTFKKTEFLRKLIGKGNVIPRKVEELKMRELEEGAVWKYGSFQLTAT